MNIDIQRIRTIVDDHTQLYRNSCSPSLAEMLLKVDCAVPSQYYDEQHRDRDTNVGLANINNRTIAGRTLRRLQDEPSTKEFSDRIDELLAADRPVGIYIRTSPTDFHGFVIAGKSNGEFVLLAKQSEQGNGEGRFTVECRMSHQELNAMSDRDCIFIEATQSTT